MTTNAPLITGAEICRLLAMGRFDLSHEKATQAAIELHLAARLPLGVLMEREKRLSAADIPDFLIDGRIAIEIKVRKLQRPQVLRQLERYAACADVEEIVLATSKGLSVPARINGKPAFHLSLGRAWL